MSEHGGAAPPSSPRPGSAPARVIAMLNQKGGVGKTTTTVNLAAALAEAGRRVLVLDLDPQAHATLHLGHDSSRTDASTYDLLLDPEAGASHGVHSVRPNLWLVPSETDLAAAETELAAAPDRQGRLARAMSGMVSPDGRPFDLILIDCPPSLGLLTVNALVAAREVIVPMQAHFLALQGVGKLLETVRMIAGALNPALRVAGVVLCMHDANTTHTQEVVADLTEFFGAARGRDVPWRDAVVLRPPIRRNIKLAECPSFGQTILDYAPTAPGAQDYRALARSLLGEPGARPPEAPPSEPPGVVRPEPPVVEVAPAAVAAEARG